MRIVIAIFLFLVMSVRSVLPLLDYAVNYDYISTQLCENQSEPDLRCNGKCYMKHEMAKSSENQSTKIQKVEFLQLFLPYGKFSDTRTSTSEFLQKRKFLVHHFNFTFQDFYPEFFHPPLV